MVFILASILRGQEGLVKGRLMQRLGQGPLPSQFIVDTGAFNTSESSKDCPFRPRRGTALAEIGCRLPDLIHQRMILMKYLQHKVRLRQNGVLELYSMSTQVNTKVNLPLCEMPPWQHGPRSEAFSAATV